MRNSCAVPFQRVSHSVAFDVMERRAIAGVQVAEQRAAIAKLTDLAKGDAELERLVWALRDLQAACQVRP